MNLEGTLMVVDDDPNILLMVKRVFEDPAVDCITCESGTECLDLAGRVNPDVVFLDLAMPGLDGFEVLRELRRRDASLPVVIITAFGELDSAVRAVHEGAYDLLTKPLDLQRLRIVARHALAMRTMTLRLASTEKPAGDGDKPARILGRHPAMVELFKMIGAASAPGNRSTVLVAGETGVGKDLVARAIHDASPERGEPFVTIQCAGVPETLIENELFGHERGAFTDAGPAKAGRVETAGQGTLFLDEVGELSPLVQTKILRLLETREFERLGGRETRHARCRFMAATNKDLAVAVLQRRFREDLFFRLKVVTIHVPPLHARREDIPILVDCFLDRIGRALGHPLFLAPSALALLQAYDFPGNVRELLHMLEQAATLARGSVILPEHLPDIPAAGVPAQPALPIVSPRLDEARRHVLELFEKRFVEDTLRQTGGNVTAAAQRAGVHRQHFQRLMQRHAVESRLFRDT
ncbi:MAG: sigma-54-dependent Fis family transcriptional regulator [Planctomycetes bacterium]|nr:sigma-54-dependent Fis family transcriptional regulator [Planctomycetota bacterium]